MTSRLKVLLFTLFLASGFCGLLYQLVWVRLAFASFGVNTSVLSVVLSVFMGGLFVGSLVSGNWVEAIARRGGFSVIYCYAAAELGVAAGAFAVPWLFTHGAGLLLGSGGEDSTAYLLRSAVVISVALFPWCFAMGATFPSMVAYLKEQGWSDDGGFGFLYLANVCGALLGVALTAVALVELLGFRGTLAVGATANAAIGLTALALGIFKPPRVAAGTVLKQSGPALPCDVPPTFADVNLFVTGFVCMGMEVVWTRAFIPVLSTEVYAFALILFSYLLSTALGSAFYRGDRIRGSISSTGSLLGILVLGALLPLALNDPRLHGGSAAALVSLLPFCFALGYLTPRLIDGRSQGDPKAVGRAYAVNVLGCVLGPLLASYGLLPCLGVKVSLLVLTLPLLALWAWAPRAAGRSPFGRFAALTAAAVAMALTLVGSKTYEDRPFGLRGPWELRRDATATVVSYDSFGRKQLMVNGIDITYQTTITKVMAHLPMAVVALSHPPGAALDICFGMGTTFRALTRWNGPVTAVELVPSVRDAFGYYYADSAVILRDPRVRIVIDDGRRFLRRTRQRFDVITIDPPPPVSAAGSSLLYSKQFYALVRSRLAPGGILQQWLPNGDAATYQSVTRALLDSFPYVRMYPSCLDWGYHYLASLSPIPRPTGKQLEQRMPAAAKRDLLEWSPGLTPALIFDMSLTHEIDPRLVAADWPEGLSDDRPFNEYYLLRLLVPGVRY